MRSILVAGLAAALLACGSSESQAPDTAAQAPTGTSLEEPTYRFADLAVERSGNLYLAGQPDLAALEAARNAGVVAVVNLRQASEMTWDEAAAVEQLGLAYHHVPIGRSTDTDAAHAEVDRILAGTDGPVLVHCASGGRVQRWLAHSALSGS
jgi:uncharacterized protein (TIGR01244 family)